MAPSSRAKGGAMALVPPPPLAAASEVKYQVKVSSKFKMSCFNVWGPHKVAAFS